LGAIIVNSPSPVGEMERVIVQDKDRIVDLSVSDIQPNPDQPRLHFDEAEIEGLSESIRSVGLIQPIMVRKVADHYQIVAGERRYRATKLAGLPSIRAIVIEANEEQNFSIALIENVQRQNLDPIEEAKAYKVLISRFDLNQTDVAMRVGKGRESISNSLRLLNLPIEIQDSLSAGKITVGHSKVLLGLENPDDQMGFYRQTVDKSLSVRALEQMIADSSAPSKGKKSAKPGKVAGAKEAQVRAVEDKLRKMLGTKVEIKHSGTKGRIEITYYSLDDFERIVDHFAKGKK
ncbi:MAG: ParB/RepB/Spo0J family partition protein, partial [Spirochaetota bacterium]